ncbi:YciI family protein [Glycomyces sp. TRM65418]|uniref:YciI family protein n=1 Tax=Glycomyces sp. TRM65418 TaxID=2867006 RepID=UPI001CE63BC1|nr:YciI family protein [Glycomyces sp. TRM65418]MCC3761610.1 YciI family protein [Glycomyces sp. TRM65418]QZD55706.1 YciI family protein [Glycomyces sp. TRM65418]
MQFLLTTRDDGTGADVDEAMHAELMAFIKELSDTGVLVATGGLDAGTRVVSAGGSLTLTDGPFAETKEAIVSFALVEVDSREEAIDVSRRFVEIFGGGTSTVQQVFGPVDA